MINIQTTALAAIELAMELSIHAQELGRDLPQPRAQYIEAFYNFLTADTQQSYDVRFSALRTKLSSVKTEMSGDFRTRLNRAQMARIGGLESHVAALNGVALHKIQPKSTPFNLPNIGISDDLLSPSVFIEHAQRIANKIEKMSEAIADNNWGALVDIDQNYISKNDEPNDENGEPDNTDDISKKRHKF